MKRQFYRRLLALSTAVLLGLSSLFPSIAGATEITAEEPAVTDTVDPAAIEMRCSGCSCCVVY